MCAHRHPQPPRRPGASPTTACSDRFQQPDSYRSAAECASRVCVCVCVCVRACECVCVSGGRARLLLLRTVTHQTPPAQITAAPALGRRRQERSSPGSPRHPAALSSDPYSPIISLRGPQDCRTCFAGNLGTNQFHD